MDSKLNKDLRDAEMLAYLRATGRSQIGAMLTTVSDEARDMAVGLELTDEQMLACRKRLNEAFKRNRRGRLE